jgi:hypothetical protein
MLTHASQRVRADALRACADQRLDVEHAEVLRAVRRALRRPATRLVALRVLQTVEPRAVSRGLVDDVAPCLAADDRSTHYRAAGTIATFGRRARHALPALAAAYQRHVAANPIERGYRNSGSEYHSYRLAYAALRLGGAAAWSVEAPWVVEALVRHVSCDPLDTEGLAALEWLGPSAAAAEPAVAARAAELLDQLWDRADRVAPIATLISIAPGGARTHELRERVLARAPELAATLDARLVAFAPHADRATRMLAWLAATPPLVHLFLTDLAELALDEIEAAPATATLAALPQLPRTRGFERIHPRLERIAVRGALRR